MPFSDDVEKVAADLGNLITEKTLSGIGVSSRLLSLKLLENDAEFEAMALDRQPELAGPLREFREKITASHGRTSEQVISSERHALAMNLFEHVACVKSRHGKPWRERLDKVLMHPQGGYVLLAGIMTGFFLQVFMIGKEIETPLLALFEKFSLYLNAHVSHGSLIHHLLNGLIQGFSGGIGIALPYLVPFLIGLSVLEDTGYLPRAAFLLDFAMHRFGLHGKSIIPFVLSYGCNVPAIMSARILERPRDRYITAALSTLIPCAARTTIIFGIVGFFIGPVPALLLYLLNIVVIAAAGKVLAHLHPDQSQGMVLEIPPYRIPSAGALAKKTWFRLREFIVIAWPLLIAGSLILSVLDYFHLSGAINDLLSPLVGFTLGLPKEVGVTLVFGVLRKELALVMLIQVLGTHDLSSVMTHAQMMVFTVFSMFYVPCLATIGVLRAVLGTKGMLAVVSLTTGIGVALAMAARIFMGFF
jgi:ferrous iron transport protein B